MITLERESNPTSANCGWRTSGSIVQPGCTIEVNAEGSVQAGGEEGLTEREREPWEIIYFKGTRARFARGLPKSYLNQ